LKISLIQTNYLLYFQVSLGLGRYEPLLIDPYEELQEKNTLSVKDKFSKLVLSATDTEMTDHTLRDLLPDDRYFRFNPYLSGELQAFFAKIRSTILRLTTILYLVIL
jgi:hypothetical protein